MLEIDPLPITPPIDSFVTLVDSGHDKTLLTKVTGYRIHHDKDTCYLWLDVDDESYRQDQIDAFGNRNDWNFRHVP